MPRPKFIWPLALLLCLALPAWALAQQPAKKARYAKPFVKVTGQARLELKPDRVQISVGVVSKALKAKDAAAQNALAMTKVLKALKAALGPKDRIQTSGYRLSAYYEWNQATRKNVFKGYKASNQVRVSTGQIGRAGELLDAATQAGANSVSGPSWSVSDPSAARIKAQTLAFADAKRQAMALARAAGAKLGPVRSIVVPMASAGNRAPMPMAVAKAAAPATPVEPGRINFQATVRCSFGLLPAK